MNLAIDVGNTRTKLAVFQNNKLIELVISEKEELLNQTKKILSEFNISDSIISNVSIISSEYLEFLNEKTNLFQFNYETKIPFKNLYTTPKTLGLDRIALTTAAFKNFPKKNVLILDAGTCITYDFINKKSEYLGGAISPGLSMRYKALNNFTAKLPFLESKIPEDFIGDSTDSSIHSGVVNGLINEIEGVINQYKEKYKYLTVVLTGGDTKFLSKQLKSTIFANQNFLLEGLNEILIFNKNK